MNFSIDGDHFSNKYPHSYHREPFLLEKLLFTLSKKWIAGYNIDAALNYALGANKRGLKCIINYLGEDLKNVEMVKNTVIEYKNLIKKMKVYGIKDSISIKPTQIGLSLDIEFLSRPITRNNFDCKKEQYFFMDRHGIF